MEIGILVDAHCSNARGTPLVYNFSDLHHANDKHPMKMKAAIEIVDASPPLGIVPHSLPVVASYREGTALLARPPCSISRAIVRKACPTLRIIWQRLSVER